MTATAGGDGGPTAQPLATLSRLLHLAQRTREATTPAELAFVAVNETRDLVAYRQAALWESCRGIIALSGVVAPEANSPYVHWLERVLRRIAAPAPSTSQRLSAADLPEELAGEWQEWLPTHALYLPFAARTLVGGWLLAREEPWSDAEIALLTEWCALWSPAWGLAHATITPPLRQRLADLWAGLRQWRPTRSGWRALFTSHRGRWALAILAILLFPVRLSVIAPGQLVPAHPAVLRSPLDGIVDRILVQPNEAVKSGQTLVEFDRISIVSRLDVARQTLATAETEYRQFAQQAVTENRSKSQMAALQGRIEEKRVELAYLETLNQRALLIAPRDGIALLDEPTEWVGRPVTTGERILVVADERDAEIEAWLSPGDVIPLPATARATIYLNTLPFSPVTGSVRYLAHEPQIQADGSYAYRLRARLEAGEQAPRVGLKGSVKVYGSHVPFLYWVLRRPIAAARGLIGW